MDPIHEGKGVVRVARMVGLGCAAGVAVLLGLFAGRLWAPGGRHRGSLDGIAVAIGVQLYLLWAVLGEAYAPVDSALQQLRDELDGAAAFVELALVFFAGLLLGFGALVGCERRGRHGHAAVADAEAGPGSTAEPGYLGARPNPERLGMMIAVAFGLYNLATGLALGVSGSGGATPLMVLFVVGLMLVNGIGGFAAVAPLATTTASRPGWGLLARMGLIGGGPAVVGTLVGALVMNSMDEAFLRTVDREFAPNLVSVGLLALAAGAIVYVLVQLAVLAGRRTRRDSFHGWIVAALVLGFIANMLLTLGHVGA